VLPTGLSWQHPGLQGARTIICHNDVSSRKPVFRGGWPVAFLDWDLASPAPSAWDLAQAAWRFVPFSGDAGCARKGWPSPPDQGCRLRALCDGYGLSDPEREGFSGLVARRMEDTASGIKDLAAGGSPAHDLLVREGVPPLVRDDKAWVERNVGRLDAALFEGLSGG
jgi:Phosphotransferase enzyme family